MELHDPQTLLSLYSSGKMDVQMAMRQGLQHIDQLHENQKEAGKDPQQLGNQVDQFEKEIKTLRQEVKRLQQKLTKINQLENIVAGLNVTLYQLKDEVDSLKA